MALDPNATQHLLATVGGTVQTLAYPVSYASGRFQDIDNLNVSYSISDDGSSAALFGNAWKAFAFEDPFRIRENTILEFDLTVTTETSNHVICLDETLGERISGNWNPFTKSCFWLTGSKETFECYEDGNTHSSDINTCTWTQRPERRQDEGTEKHVKIHVGHYSMYFLDKQVNYLGLIQNQDGSSVLGESTFSNIVIYDDTNAPKLQAAVDGNNVELGRASEYAVGRWQDYNQIDPYEISEDGQELSLSGNAWKAFELLDPYTIDENSVLEFDFTLSTEAESHVICLDETQGERVSGNWNPYLKSCFWLAGSETSFRCYEDGTYYSSDKRTCTWKQLPADAGRQDEGTTKHFKIHVGHFSMYFLGKNVRYVSFVQEDNSLLLGESKFSNIIITTDDAALRLSANVNGEDLFLERAVEYANGRWQDYNQIDPYRIVTNNGFGTRIELLGNAWKGFGFPDPFEIKENSVLEFDFTLTEEAESQAICLGETLGQRVSGNWNPYLRDCFWLAGTKTSFQCFEDGTYYSSDKSTCTWKQLPKDSGNQDEGTTKHFRIHIGHYSMYFLGETVNYLGLVQEDSALITGESAFGNITLWNDPDMPKLRLRQHGTQVELGRAVEYAEGRWQDYNQIDPYQISTTDSVSKIELNGNSWKAFELRDSTTIEENTVLEFDFELTSEVESHVICLDDTVGGRVGSDWNPYTRRCFWVGGTETTFRCYEDGTYYSSDKRTCTWTQRPEDPIREGEGVQHFKIHVGHYSMYLLGEAVNYLAFIQEDSSLVTGKSVFSNVILYKDETAPRLIAEVEGETQELERPLGYAEGRWQDYNIVDPYKVSSDGTAVSLFGNSWKAFELGTPFTVEDNTVLEFDFTLTTEAESHLVCLDSTLGQRVGSDWNPYTRNCFWLAGSKQSFQCYEDGTYYSSDKRTCTWTDTVTPLIEWGAKKHYAVHVGLGIRDLVGVDVKYLAVISMNKEDREIGESTISDFRLYNACNAVYGGDGLCERDCGAATCSEGVCSPSNFCLPFCNDSFCKNGGSIINLETCECSCQSGWTGPDCSRPVCSLNCQNGGNLVSSDSECTCACAGNWAGEECNECAAEYFGDDCSIHCGEDNCPTGTCSSEGSCVPNCNLECENGEPLMSDDGECACICQGNWAGTECNVCVDNFYGDNCSISCGPDNCDGTCDQKGDCIATVTTVTEELEEDDGPSTAVIAGVAAGSAVGILALLAVVFTYLEWACLSVETLRYLCCCCKRKNGKDHHSNSDQDTAADSKPASITINFGDCSPLSSPASSRKARVARVKKQLSNVEEGSSGSDESDENDSLSSVDIDDEESDSDGASSSDDDDASSSDDSSSGSDEDWSTSCASQSFDDEQVQP